MKKLFGFTVVAVVLALPLVSFAAEFQVGKDAAIRTTEQVASNAYLAGGSVSSAGSVTGDVLAGGGNVLISGAVGGDVAAGGGNVTLLAPIGGDVRVGGGNIIIEGKVGGDVVGGGGQITLDGQGVGGDVALGGGNIRITAPIAGSVRIGGGSVYIDAPVTGDLMINAHSLTLGSHAVITGNIHYKGTEKLVTEDGAVVQGTVVFVEREVQTKSAAVSAALFSVWVLGKFLTLLACALIVGLVLRRYTKSLLSAVVERPVLELGRGVIVLAALPALCVLLCVTLVGIPFGILGFLSFAALLILSWIVAPILVGSVVYRYFSKRELEVSWKTILLGVFLCTLLEFIPFVGWLACAFLMLVTLGAISSEKWRIVKQLQ